MPNLPQELPLHGPYDPVRTTDAAHLVHELVRYLNYATRHAAALPGAMEAHETVGALRLAAAQLPQAFSQVGRRVPGSAAAAEALREASAAATALADKLSAVQFALHGLAMGEAPHQPVRIAA
jgi:hypothetical protein